MTVENPALTSVIMVSYQTGEVLFRAIEHVLAQTAEVELCLVDNGNPPEIVERLQALAAEKASVKFLTGHGNVGFSKACNLGAKAASGGNLLFLNPDSLLPRDTVERLKNYTETLRRPFMLGARLLDEDGKDQRGCRRALLTPTTALIEALHLGFLFPKARLNFNHAPIPEKIAPVPAISGAFMYLPQGDFWMVEGFDEGYFLHVEDLDLCWRFRKAGGEIYFAPDIAVTHIGGTSKATNAFIEKNKAKGFHRYFHQNFKDNPSVLLFLLDIAITLRCWIKVL